MTFLFILNYLTFHFACETACFARVTFHDISFCTLDILFCQIDISFCTFNISFCTCHFFWHSVLHARHSQLQTAVREKPDDFTFLHFLIDLIELFYVMIQKVDLITFYVVYAYDLPYFIRYGFWMVYILQLCNQRLKTHAMESIWINSL